MIQSILSNLAIILLMHLTMSTVYNFQRKIKPIVLKVITILLNSASVIILFYLPIQLIEGYFVDMRFIPLVFLAYIQGWKLAIPSLLIAATWRFFMGGAGMPPGIIFGMVLPTLVALAFHPRSKLKKRYVEKIFVIVLCWFVCDFPIIFIVPNGLEIFQDTALIRITSFVITAIILYTFIMQDRQRRFLNHQLMKMADEDPLTKLLNKRKFFEVIEEKLKILKPNHYIAMIDIDHFKKVNDTYGHLFGDKILCEVANLLKKYENRNIVISRFGGEEFILYFGETDYETTKLILEEIRREIKNTTFIFNEKIPVTITISIGLAPLKSEHNLIESIYFADQNLYKAKQSGRDCLI